jgi:prevent-host-death family protein
MSSVNIAKAKTQLSALLRRVKAGETIVISERNVPIAELGPLRTAPRKRELGPLYPGYEVPESFFEPLPEELLRGFEGRGEE